MGIDVGGEVLMNEGPDAPFEALGLECFWWSYWLHLGWVVFGRLELLEFSGWF